MKRFLPFLGRLVFAWSVLVPVAALHAQLTKIFVASTGNDANDGSRGSPKRNFQPAHNAVAAGGQIVVLDTAGYGALNISKSLAVTVPPGVNGFVTVSGNSNGVLITVAPSDTVSLRGLIIEGGGAGAGGVGIFAPAVGTLIVEDCAVRGFNVGTYLFNSNGGHLVVRGGSVRATQTGIELLAANSNVVVEGVISGCAVDNASVAALDVEVLGSGAFARLTAVGCTLTNSGNGLQAVNIGAALFADACTVSGNTNGIVAANGAIAQSRVNNLFTTNNADGSFNGTLSGK